MEQNPQTSNEIQIDFREIISLLVSKIGIIILTGMICALVTLVYTKIFVQPQYQSVTKMYVLSKQNQDTLTNSDMQISTLLTKDYTELIKSRTVTESVIAKMGLELTHEQLINKMEVATTTDTRIITIKVKDSDPYMARDLANAIRDTAAEHIKMVMNTEAVNIVDEANVPSEKFSPHTKRNGFLAGVLGCFISVIIILMQYLTNDTIQTAEDVEKYLGLSTMGTIPIAKSESRKKKKKIRYKRR